MSGAGWCEKHQRRECGSVTRSTPDICHARVSEGRASCRRHEAPHPDDKRAVARGLVAIAIRHRALTRCEACELSSRRVGDPGPRGWPVNAIHAHHEDYDRPLDVIWLCGGCHYQVHQVHGSLPATVAWFQAQLAGAERLLASREQTKAAS